MGKTFAESSPEVRGAFMQMRAAASNDNSILDYKTFEMISMAVAVARMCKPCIRTHAELCVKYEVSREALVEALNVAAILCGGPGFAYSEYALEQYDKFMDAK